MVVLAGCQHGVFKEDAVMANTTSSPDRALTVTFDINAAGQPLAASTLMADMPTKLASIHVDSLRICPAYLPGLIEPVRLNI